MRFLRAVLAIVALLTPTFASALSCLPHELAYIFQEARDAKEPYVVVHGKLSFNSNRLPEVDMQNQHKSKPDNLLKARIKGKALSLNGFDFDFSRGITLNVQCFGPWCASAVPNIPYLAFLRKTAQGYQLDVNPCGGFGFPQPSDEMLDQVTACMQGKPCTPKLQ